MVFKVLLQWDSEANAWTATVPELNDICTFGSDKEEALAMAKDMIIGYLEASAKVGSEPTTPVHLPRVVELFEARTPKGRSVMASVGGAVKIIDDEDGKRIVITTGEDEVVLKVSRRAHMLVSDGDIVEPGVALTEGPFDPKEVLEVQGVRACQQYLVDQVQEVYRSQGVDIHDKHIEMIVRQMLRRVRIVKPNESNFLPNEFVPDRRFRRAHDLASLGRNSSTSCAGAVSSPTYAIHRRTMTSQ